MEKARDVASFSVPPPAPSDKEAPTSNVGRRAALMKELRLPPVVTDRFKAAEETAANPSRPLTPARSSTPSSRELRAVASAPPVQALCHSDSVKQSEPPVREAPSLENLLEAYTEEEHTAFVHDLMAFGAEIFPLLDDRNYRLLAAQQYDIIRAKNALFLLAQKQRGQEKVTPEQIQHCLNTCQAAQEKFSQSLTAWAQKEKEAEQAAQKLTQGAIELRNQAALLVRATLQGGHVRGELQAAARTNEHFQAFRTQVFAQTERAKALSQAATMGFTKEQRRALYGHVTYLREEIRYALEATELVPAEKELSSLQKKMPEVNKKPSQLLKEATKTQQVVDPKKLAKLASEQARLAPRLSEAKARHAAALHHIAELTSVVDAYYQELAFTDEELADPQFRALSVESHRPVREHLVLFAQDILTGATHIAQNARTQQRDTFLQAVIDSDSAPQGATHLLPPELASLDRTQIKALLDLKEKKSTLTPQEIRKELPFLTKLNDEALALTWETLIEAAKYSLPLPYANALINLGEVEKAAHELESIVHDQQESVRSHQDLGNNLPKEFLATDKEKWKDQQKKASEALQKMVSVLLPAVADVAWASKPFSEKKKATIFGEDSLDRIKEAGHMLTAARDAVIGDHTRWSAAIDKEVQLPLLDPEGRLLGIGFTTSRQSMTCLNAGYSSAAFRGRESSQSPIQPNFWGVRLTPQVGREEVYSRSALQVEFFCGEKNKRMESTRCQVLEVLSLKALQAPLASETANSIDHPMILETSEISLLSPDALRPALGELPHVRALADRLGASFDQSNYERRMMEENREAWMTFDIHNAQPPPWKDGDQFLYVDGEGKQRQVTVHLKTTQGNKTEVVFEIAGETPPPRFVKFDIAYYNVGVCHFTKLMNETVSQTEAIKKLQKLSQSVLDKVLSKMPTVLRGLLNTSFGRRCAATLIRLKFGITLKPDNLAPLLAPTGDGMMRLLSAGPALLQDMVATKEGRAFLANELVKQDIQVTAQDLEGLQHITWPDVRLEPPPSFQELVSWSLQTFKAVLSNPGGQAIVLALLKKEANPPTQKPVSETETSMPRPSQEPSREDLKKEASPPTQKPVDETSASTPPSQEPSLKDLQKLADAIPTDFKMDERMPLEKVFSEELPYLAPILQNTTGQLIVQALFRLKGKEVSTQDLADMGKELASAHVGAETGPELEDAINLEALQKHQERVQRKVQELDRGNAERLTQIEEVERPVIDKLDQALGELKTAREKLLQCEQDYAKEKSAEKLTARDEAFKSWQKARDRVVCLTHPGLEGTYPGLKAQGIEKPSDLLLQYLNRVAYQQDLLDLLQEAEDQLEFQAYRETAYMKESMYSLSSTLSLLGIRLEENPHFCCRSGKDRTSLQDIEVRTKWHLRNVRGRFLNYREIAKDPLTEATRQAELLQSGMIDELAYKNVGSYGLNFSGGYGSYLSGFGHVGKVWEESVAGGVYKVFQRSLKA